MPTARLPIDAAHRAASSDAHAIGAVTGLTDALAGKEAVALLATYVHSGNPSAAVSAVTYNADTPANTFTSVGHPFQNGYRVSICVNPDAAIDYSLKFLPTGITFGQYYVVGKTTDTFQLSATSGGAPVALTPKATLDLTKWHVEFPSAHTTITGLAATRHLRIRFSGACSRGGIYFYPQDARAYSNNFVQVTNTATNRYATIANGNIANEFDVLLDTSSWLSIITDGITVAASSDSANTVARLQSASYMSTVFRAYDMTGISLPDSYLQNGTRVEVYSL